MKNASRKIAFLFFVLGGALPGIAWASACCSGGASLPAVLLNDDRWAARLLTSNAFVVGSVNGGGRSEWREDSTDEHSLIFSPSLVYRFGDYWQFGLRSSLRRRSISEQAKWGFGDTVMSAALEPFPPYIYSPWKPRFFMVAALSAPTGLAPYDTNKGLVAANGSGFWSPALAVLFSKNVDDFDLVLSGELKYQFERVFKYENVEPGMIYSSKLGAGYTFSGIRFGAMMGLAYEEAKKLKKANTTNSSKLVWDTQFDLSADVNVRWSVHLAYADQTLMGPAFNSDLERNVSLGIIYHGL